MIQIHSDCSFTSEEFEKIADRIIEKLRQEGMRQTPALRELLAAMLAPHQPYTLAELCERPGLVNRDQATVYRLIHRLEDVGVVQQVNLGNRGASFQLILPDHHHDYLHCRSCGLVQEVPIGCLIEKMQKQLAQEYGWKNLSHSLAFHGECPDCTDPA
ncbi:MAG: Fur family transcriptional regulator [Verrucomicrobiota bacterium]